MTVYQAETIAMIEAATHLAYYINTTNEIIQFYTDSQALIISLEKRNMIDGRWKHSTHHN